MTLFRFLAIIVLSVLPVIAVAQQTAFGSGNVDPDAPVEVESDELQVSEADGTAEFLGNVVIIQGDMRLECQLASNGIYFSGEPPESEREKIETLTPGASDWILLLQIDTDDRESGPGWMWGDVGCLYFWIKKQDLAAGNFDAIWGVLQCY